MRGWQGGYLAACTRAARHRKSVTRLIAPVRVRVIGVRVRVRVRARVRG